MFQILPGDPVDNYTEVEADPQATLKESLGLDVGIMGAIFDWVFARSGEIFGNSIRGIGCRKTYHSLKVTVSLSYLPFLLIYIHFVLCSFSGKIISEKLLRWYYLGVVGDCGSTILIGIFIDYAFCSAVSWLFIRLYTIFRKINRMAEIPDSSCMFNCRCWKQQQIIIRYLKIPRRSPDLDLRKTARSKGMVMV